MIMYGPPAVESAWVRKMRALLGLRVEVTYATDPAHPKQRGHLCRFSDDGEVVIEDETGTRHWIWPCLDIEGLDG